MKKLFYLSVIVVFYACGSSSDRSDGFSDTAGTPEDSLFNEVMDLHNEAMAKMSRLISSRKLFDDKADSLKNLKSSAREAIQKSYESLSLQLREAEDNMNKWMQEFSIDSAQDNIQRRIEYLTSEKSKVAKVKEEILSVLARADSALKK